MASRERLINCDLRGTFPQAVRGEGIYLYDGDGKRYLDGCGGALVVNFGHQVPEIAQAMVNQARNPAYVYRFHFSCPPAEDLAERYCCVTDVPMGRTFFTNSVSHSEN